MENVGSDLFGENEFAVAGQTQPVLFVGMDKHRLASAGHQVVDIDAGTAPGAGWLATVKTGLFRAARSSSAMIFRVLS